MTQAKCVIARRFIGVIRRGRRRLRCAALRPSLATVDGSLLMLSTPFGKRGEPYRAWTEGEGWTRSRVPASMCPRHTKAFLDEEQRELGPMRYSEEYELAFLEPDEDVFMT